MRLGKREKQVLYSLKGKDSAQFLTDITDELADTDELTRSFKEAIRRAVRSLNEKDLIGKGFSNGLNNKNQLIVWIPGEHEAPVTRERVDSQEVRKLVLEWVEKHELGSKVSVKKGVAKKLDAYRTLTGRFGRTTFMETWISRAVDRALSNLAEDGKLKEEKDKDGRFYMLCS